MSSNTSKILTETGRQNLKTLVELAKKYLGEKNTPYAKNKDEVKNFFQEGKNTTLSKVLLLDAMYSTNLSKASYAATEIAQAIDKHKVGLDEFANQLEKNQANICDLKKFKGVFDKEYGVKYSDNDNDHKGKIMLSFWSKYLYFTSGYNFPIFDSLAQETIKKLKDNKYFTGDKNIKNFNEFCGIVSNIKADLGKFSYSDLDNFFWLFGKINNGSFSLLLSQEQYKSVLNWVKENDGLEKDNHEKESKNERLKHTIKKKIVLKIKEKDEEYEKFFGSTSKKCPNVTILVKFIAQCNKWGLL